MYDRKQKLISFQAEDGFKIHALLLTGEFPGSDELLNAPVILHVHGVLGHFLARGTPRLLPPALLEHGFSSLSINTRMAFMGQIMGEGVFDDTIKDVDAAVDFLKREGFRKVFILGYSLGANIAAYYASERFDSDVHGLILEGCSSSLPDSQRRRLRKWDSSPAYDEIYDKAKEILGPAPYESKSDQVFIINRAQGDTLKPFDSEFYTYKTWWFMRGPEAYNAETHRLVSKIKIPILFIHGDNDDMVERWEVEDLVRLARESGNMGVALKYISRSGHDCMENSDATIDAIVGWISDRMHDTR